jgi:hypothetical protein
VPFAVCLACCVSVDSRCAVLSQYEVYDFLRKEHRVPPWGVLESLTSNVTRLQKFRRPFDKVGKQSWPPPKDLPFLSSAVHVPWAPLSVSCVSDRWAVNDFRSLAAVSWMRERTLKYLAAQPCVHQSKRKILQFFERVNDFLGAEKLQLTVGELRALIDLRPDSVVEVHSIIDEREERINQQQTEQLLQIVQSTLSPKTAEEEQEERAEHIKEEQKQRMTIEQEQNAEQQRAKTEATQATHQISAEPTNRLPLYMQLLSTPSVPIDSQSSSASSSSESASSSSSSSSSSSLSLGRGRGRTHGRGRGGGQGRSRGGRKRGSKFS